MPDDIKINIVTKADTSGVKQTDAAVGGIRTSLRELVPGFARVESAIGRIAGAGAGGAAAGLGAIGVAFTAAAKGVREFAEAQEAVAGLDAALAQAGLLTDAYREKMQSLATQLSATTAIADEEWIGVLQRLTQFGAQPDQIEGYADAVKNLAGILGGDLQSAAQGISKAMQGNYQMFSRWGIVVDEAGTQAEKLNQLFETLAARGGGQLEARAQTLAGQWRTLKIGMGELFEAIGGGIAKTGLLDAVLFGLGRSANWLAGVLGGTVPQLAGLRNAAQKTIAPIEDAAEATARLKAATDELKESTKQATAALEHELRIINLRYDAQQKQTQAERDYQLAVIDRKEGAGQMTREQAIDARAKVEVGAIQKAATLEKDEAAEQAAARAKLIDQQKSKEAELTQKIADTERLIEERRAEEKTKAEIGHAEAQISAARKELVQAETVRQYSGLGGIAAVESATTGIRAATMRRDRLQLELAERRAQPGMPTLDQLEPQHKELQASLAQFIATMNETTRMFDRANEATALVLRSAQESANRAAALLNYKAQTDVLQMKVKELRNR